MMTIEISHKLLYKVKSFYVVKGKSSHVVNDTMIPQAKRNVIRVEFGPPRHEIFFGESILLSKHEDMRHPSAYMTPQRGYVCMAAEKHLKSLDSYLGKLQNDVKHHSLKSVIQRVGIIVRSDIQKAENGLSSLENYLGKVKTGPSPIPRGEEPENHVAESLRASVNASSKNVRKSEREFSLQNYMEFRVHDAKDDQESADNTSDLYLIGAIASINIAVLLFEIATPVKNSTFELFSIPSLYGAKINTLILTGEWWRLVTPMFLHAGIFHMALGIWTLFTFGLEVSREYGPFKFLLIYLLGGISGNMISFLHTPEPTVGGTGPVFALIGAWLIHQFQNKDVITRDSSERMFQNAMIVTALSFVISSFGPIDDWAHFAAAITGVAYGYVTCPTLKVKDASSKTGQEEGTSLVQQYADPCRSLAYFSLFLLLLSSLLFVIEPPFNLIA